LLYSWRATQKKQEKQHHHKRYSTGYPQMLRQCYRFASSRNNSYAELEGILGNWELVGAGLVFWDTTTWGLAVCTARMSRAVLSMGRADWSRAALEMIDTGVVLEFGLAMFGTRVKEGLGDGVLAWAWHGLAWKSAL
jgi:hypothetical protein